MVGNIGGIFNRGWEYLWVRHSDDEDSDAKVLVKRPTAVYVEELYRCRNFALLGIGS